MSETTEVEGFTLLRSREEFDGAVQSRDWARWAAFPEEPTGFPVYAMFCDHRSDSEWVFLYPADVAAMQAALVAMEDRTIKTPLLRALEVLISEISEECYCAGWMSGIEHDLWRIISGPWSKEAAKYGQSYVYEMDYDALKEVSRLAGAWFSDFVTPVSIADWLPMYEARRKEKEKP